MPGPIVGRADVNDTAKTNRYLRTPYIKASISVEYEILLGS